MAVETRRRCGYRKVGGIYLCGSGSGHPCDRMPFELSICPCCGHGIKQSRGWTWVDINMLVDGVHRNCKDGFPCPLCMATSEMGRVGLLWVGAQFYPTPMDFAREASTLGISRRISAVPREFKLGETWVMLAHPKGMTCVHCLGECPTPPCAKCSDSGKVPAVFRVFLPAALEIIITESQSKDADCVKGLRDRGLVPVVVPDNDADHQGSVFDKDTPRDRDLFEVAEL